MKSDDEWVRPEDPTDVLPEELRRDALRRRKFVRVGNYVVGAILFAAFLVFVVVDFLWRVYIYGSTYQELFR